MDHGIPLLYDVSWHTTIPTPTILTKTRPVVVVAVALWASLTSHPAMPISTLHGVVQSTPPWMQFGSQTPVPKKN